MEAADYQKFTGQRISFWRAENGVPGISPQVLTDNLRALEADGLITLTVYPEVPPRVKYDLSDLGNSLRPLFKSMEDWGNSYMGYVASNAN